MNNSGDPVEQLLGFFDSSILATYRAAPDKYELTTDEFEGEVRNTRRHAEAMDESGSYAEAIHIRFGYRTLADGTSALVVFLPDLYQKSRGHVAKWAGFRLQDSTWAEPDDRYERWRRRNIEADFDVDNGPMYYLEDTVRRISALTLETVDAPLFRFESNSELNIPAAENTHAYQDAHEKLYGYVVDGLNKEAIQAIATQQGYVVHAGGERTIAALQKALPGFAQDENFYKALGLVSANRRSAGHGVRPPAEHFPATKTFTADIVFLNTGLESLLTHLENVLGMASGVAEERQSGKAFLPRIAGPVDGVALLNSLPTIEGKTVERVEFGAREAIDGLHRSEALILHFTDGSSLGIDTGSNAVNVSWDHEGMRPDDVSINFDLHWVPPPR